MINVERMLCFKPTRNMHESGYRYIEYGYWTWSENDKNESIKVIGRYDVIQTDWHESLQFSLDLTKSGWFRIMTDSDLEWTYGGGIKVVDLACEPQTPAQTSFKEDINIHEEGKL